MITIAYRPFRTVKRCRAEGQRDVFDPVEDLDLKVRTTLLYATHLEGLDGEVPSAAGLTGIIDNWKKVVVGLSGVEATDGLTFAGTDGLALFETDRVLEDPIGSNDPAVLVDHDHPAWDRVEERPS